MSRMSKHDPHYDLTESHYVLRVGIKDNPNTVNYPTGKGRRQTEDDARASFRGMKKLILEQPRQDYILHIRLIFRKVGTPRANGRLRFYETELESFTY